MTNLDIDRRLALAIGYRPQHVMTPDSVVPGGRVLVVHDGLWRKFDYRDERTIYPIAEHFKMMPVWNTQYNQWTIAKVAPRGSMPSIVLNDDPRTCIALAIIEAAERGLL